MSSTDERVALTIKMWNEGRTAGQSAVRIGGVTRKAVIGKIHQLSMAGWAQAATVNGVRKPTDKAD